MELREKIVEIIEAYVSESERGEFGYSEIYGAEDAADRILSLEPIAQALKLTVVSPLENR